MYFMKEGLEIVSLTYQELKTMRDLGQLSTGQYYRITDYVTTTVQDNTKSAGHPFDLVVVALDNNTLSDQAGAVLHDDDVYFRSAVASLESWQLWYCLDNDKERFVWADQDNGKGVIYRMIDEWNNDVPYDFKNILFLNDNDDYVYTFGNDLSGGCHNNSMMPCFDVQHTGDPQMLNFNILGRDNHDNRFDDFCCYNELGNDCCSNVFSGDCYGNTLMNSCRGNSLGENCHNNTFGDECSENRLEGDNAYNKFADRCIGNFIGYRSKGNTFDSDCSHNKLESYCSQNEFECRCHSNTLGRESGCNEFMENCSFNILGLTCGCNFFENGCHKNKMGDRCHNNSFGQDCCNNILYNNCDNNSFGSNCCNNEVRASDCCNNWFEEGVDSVVILLPWGSNPRFYVASSVKDDIIILDDRKDEPILIAMTTDGTVEQFSSLELFNSPRNKILYDADYYNAVVLHLDDIDDEEMA